MVSTIRCTECYVPLTMLPHIFHTDLQLFFGLSYLLMHYLSRRYVYLILNLFQAVHIRFALVFTYTIADRRLYNKCKYIYRLTRNITLRFSINHETNTQVLQQI